MEGSERVDKAVGWAVRAHFVCGSYHNQTKLAKLLSHSTEMALWPTLSLLTVLPISINPIGPGNWVVQAGIITMF